MGCGRTGACFSFERAGIVPDIVCLSKSIGAMGMPMALNLIRPAADVWSPGEHVGTFRGNNLAFVASAAALDYWDVPDFALRIAERAHALGQRLSALVQRQDGIARHAGRPGRRRRRHIFDGPRRASGGAHSRWPAVKDLTAGIIRNPFDRFAMRISASLRRRAGFDTMSG